MKEIWKTYKETRSNRYGYRIYEVSNFGRIKLNGEIVEPRLHYGYRYYGGFKVARAVAELFISNPENKPQVDHIDTNRGNDNVTNLRWVTRSENMQNPLTRKHCSEANKGEKNPNFGKSLSEKHKRRLSESHKLYYQNLKKENNTQ